MHKGGDEEPMDRLGFNVNKLMNGLAERRKVVLVG